MNEYLLNIPENSVIDIRMYHVVTESNVQIRVGCGLAIGLQNIINERRMRFLGKGIQQKELITTIAFVRRLVSWLPRKKREYQIIILYRSKIIEKNFRG